MNLKRELSAFDITAIIIGSIIGADIYISPGLTAGLLGPASLIGWIVAGIFALIIALVFSYTSYYVPEVGGPFAFVSKAFGNFYGFLAGWIMLVAEMMTLPVFAIIFVRYLEYFIGLDFWQEILIKGLFLFSLTFVNIIGVKIGGKINDTLTVIKFVPLLFVIASCIIFLSNNPDMLEKNYTPIAPLGFENFGQVVILIFWAFAGFEMGTLPASEVKNPKKVIPKAIGIGATLVLLFYLTLNFVLYGAVNWNDLAHSPLPLVLAGSLLVGYVGGMIVGIGAMTSVSGSSAAFVLGIARLYYAISEKGFFPKLFSNTHKKYQTPYIALIVQGTVAFILSIYTGLVQLISFSVFNLSIVYLLVCLSFIFLKKEKETKFIGQKILPFIGIGICGFLLYSTSISDKIFGVILILVGIGVYVYFTKMNAGVPKNQS